MPRFTCFVIVAFRSAPRRANSRVNAMTDVSTPPELYASHLAGARRRRVVVAGSGLANSRDGMQHRKSGSSGVGIGSGVKQRGGQFKVSVFDCDQQCARAKGRSSPVAARSAGFVGRRTNRVIRVRTGLNECLQGFDPPLASREKQCCKARRQTHANVGSCLDEFPYDLGVTLRRSPHQRCLPSDTIPGAYVGPSIQERPYRTDVPRPSCRHQSRLAPPEGIVWVGSGIQQQLDHFAAAVDACQRKRCDSVAVCNSRASTGFDQQPRRRQIVPVSCPVQCRHSVHLRHARIDPLLQEIANSLRVTAFCCVC